MEPKEAELLGILVAAATALTPDDVLDSFYTNMLVWANNLPLPQANALKGLLRIIRELLGRTAQGAAFQ